MLGPPSFLARGRGQLSANLLFLYLLRTSAGVVTPPERPAWARGFGDVAFHKDRTGMKAASGTASASAHDAGHLFARAPFGRGGPQGHGGTSPSVGTARGTATATATAAASAKAAAYAGSNTLVAPPQVCIRTARREDIPYIEACNLETLPENYPNAFYHNHLLQWPYLALVAERKALAGDHDRNGGGGSNGGHGGGDDGGKKIVGYVLGRVEINTSGGPPQPQAFEPVPQDYLPGVVMPPSSSSSSSPSMHRPGAFMGTIRKTGHVSSLAVLEEYRRLGIARELMEILHVQMKFRYGVDCSTLHVRCSNRGAQKLYVNTLEYKIVETVQRYYQDGADAYYMKLDFNPQEEEMAAARQQQQQQHAMGGGRVSGSSSSSGFSVREKESALLTQDAQGYFNLYPSSGGGGGAAATSSRANA